MAGTFKGAKIDDAIKARTALIARSNKETRKADGQEV
jgi:hypothetical protein